MMNMCNDIANILQEAIVYSRTLRTQRYTRPRSVSECDNGQSNNTVSIIIFGFPVIVLVVFLLDDYAHYANAMHLILSSIIMLNQQYVAPTKSYQ